MLRGASLPAVAASWRAPLLNCVSVPVRVQLLYMYTTDQTNQTTFEFRKIYIFMQCAQKQYVNFRSLKSARMHVW